MATIFISYRRADSIAISGRIYDRLRNEFGKDTIFKDVDSIPAGKDFRGILREATADCAVMLVIIGKQWLTVTDGQGKRRLDDPADFVRQEVETGLQRDSALVIPVLVEGAIMPNAADLPPSLQELAFNNALTVRNDPDFHRDMDKLIREITPRIKNSPPKRSGLTSNQVTLIVGMLALIGAIIAALITIVPPMLERQDNANATATLTAQTQSAAAPTTQPAPTESPTTAATPTLTLSPTATDTPDVALAAQTVIAQQTAQAIVDASTATAAYIATQTAEFLTRRANETATATLWTATPTANFTASVEAILTQWARETATQQARDLTATATLWTDTPTVTFTPSKTNTPTNTPTITPTPTPTLDPALAEALSRAHAGVTSNTDWRPFVYDFGDGVNMVLVPKGCFTMGSTEEQINYAINTLGAQRDWVTDEQPTTEICFDEPFWLDETEVTQAAFVRLGGTKANANNFNGENRPVERITWFEAQAFCELRGGRLPTEAEWEYAARGPNELVYPWGNNWNAANAVWNKSQTADVKSIDAGMVWVGAFDLSGNVWEWTLSEYKNYPYVATDGREVNLDSTNVRRVLRGASWSGNDVSVFRGADRGRVDPAGISGSVGFRCARFD